MRYMRAMFLLAAVLAAACTSYEPIPEAPAGAPDAVTYIAESFDSDAFRERFAMQGDNPHVSVVPAPDADAPSARVLRVTIPRRSHTGANFLWQFRDHPPGEPDRLYSRFYIRFEPGWKSGEGGKLPGPSGTYNRAGWGGRPPDGTNGWSARMGFRDSGWPDRTLLTYYAYHVDAETQWGDTFWWDRTEGMFNMHPVGSLEHGKWYCVESYIQLNDPQRRDGRLVGWVDGKLAMDRRGLRFRTVPDLKIETYWFNVYFGGTGTPETDLVVYFDELVLADKRLGCALE